jgi:hypothetical protein
MKKKKNRCPECGGMKNVLSGTCAECYRKKKPRTKRHPLSPETRRKISLALSGKILPESTRAKMSAAHLLGKNANWKGGKTITKDGYVAIRCPSHPYANGVGYVREHRLVIEAHLGRVLLPSEVVHHINGDKTDNRYENLALCASNAEHRIHHKKARG